MGVMQMGMMIRDRPKLNDIYDDWLDGSGFFACLYKYLTENSMDIPEWLNSTHTAQELDFVYHGNFSGEKTVSRIVTRFIDDGYVTETNLKRISGAWYSLNGDNVKRYWDIYNVEYNPIENYSMHDETTTTKNGTDTVTISGKETDKNTGTQTLNGENTITNSVYGIDSTTTPAPSDKAEGTNGNTRTDDLTHEKSYTGRNNETEYDTTETTETTRTGNIGTLTSQQMIESDLELWKWNFYNSFLFPCVDKLITIPVYNLFEIAKPKNNKIIYLTSDGKEYLTLDSRVYAVRR